MPEQEGAASYDLVGMERRGWEETKTQGTPSVLTSKVDSSKIFINEPVKGRKERKKWY